MKRSTKLWIALGAVMVALQVFYFGVVVRLEPYRIGSGAMEPTLLKRDRVFVLRTKKIARGDLVTYYLPDENAALVKRAIAMPGEMIEMNDKRILINDTELRESYTKYEEEKRSDFGPHRVAAGHLFVLGDNRDNANDSRYHGDVAMTDVIGRVFLVWSPKNGLHRP